MLRSTCNLSRSTLRSVINHNKVSVSRSLNQSSSCLSILNKKFTPIEQFRSYGTKSIETVQTEKAPKAVGPYSQAVKANGFLFISGCLGLVPETCDMIDDTIEGQTNQALINLKNVLDAGNSSLANVVKTTVLLADINDFKVVNEIYADCFDGDQRPARSCFAVKDLPKGGRVEIEAIALIEEVKNERPKETVEAEAEAEKAATESKEEVQQPKE